MGIFAQIYIFAAQSAMLAPGKLNNETRGRPKKQQTRTLSPIYKEMFSDNSAIIHSSFLIYVFEVFVETKNEKRVGHKDGGFTIYDKINNEYCFDNLEEHLKQWGCQALLDSHHMRDFVKLLPALGPKIILREICKLINFIIESYQHGFSQQAVLNELTPHKNSEKLNEDYPYMRFVPKALKELKMDKNQKWDRPNSLFELIRQRVDYLWEHLVRIIIHTVFNCIEGRIHNKYFKPFFSDAENSNETYIGQLNLDQVVLNVKKNESLERSAKGSECNPEDENIDRLRKVRSIVDSEGTRTVVQIIKAPIVSTGGIVMDRKKTDDLNVGSESPSKVLRQLSEPLIFASGFNSLIKPKQVIQTSNVNLSPSSQFLNGSLNMEDFQQKLSPKPASLRAEEIGEYESQENSVNGIKNKEEENSLQNSQDEAIHRGREKEEYEVASVMNQGQGK